MKKILFIIMVLGASLGAFANENFIKAEQAYAKKEFNQAYSLYDRACGEGELRACAMNAIMLFNGDGVKQDIAHAEQIFARTCSLNEPIACAKLAELGAYGKSKEKMSEEQVRALFKKACDGGYADACMWAGEKK